MSRASAASRGEQPPVPKGVRALVLGAAGFIGAEVVRALQAAGVEVIASGRGSPGDGSWGAPGVDYVQADLGGPGSGAAVVERTRPDWVLNLCGYGVDRSERDPDLARRINAELPVELADGLAGLRGSGAPGGSHPPRLLHVGSALEYGEQGGDLREESTPRPSTLYGITKLAGTEALAERSRAIGLPSVTARLFTIYGPGEHHGRLLPTLLAARGGQESIPLTEGVQRRDFTYVEDVAEGLLRLAVSEIEPGGLVNLATGRLESVAGFCRRAAAVLGLEPERLGWGALPTRGEEMAHEPVRVARLEALCDWRPGTDLEEGIARTAARVDSGE